MTNENKTPETTEITETVDEQGGKSFPTPEAVDTPADEVSNADPIEQPEPESFPREYVEKLRKEAADSRVKAKRADELAAEVWALKVAATGRLADPSDLPYQPDTDPLQAIDDLLQTKPHLARRTPRGDVGQGATATAPAVSLIDMLR